jgi:hypothetical protein
MNNIGVSKNYITPTLGSPAFKPILDRDGGVFFFQNSCQVFTDDNFTLLPISNAGNTHSGPRIYLEITISGGSVESGEIKSGADWWEGYPTNRLYSGSKIAQNQQKLFVPICSINVDQSLSQSIFQSDLGDNVIRYLFSPIMLFAICSGIIAIPAPFFIETNYEATT